MLNANIIVLSVLPLHGTARWIRKVARHTFQGSIITVVCQTMEAHPPPIRINTTTHETTTIHDNTKPSFSAPLLRTMHEAERRLEESGRRNRPWTPPPSIRWRSLFMELCTEADQTWMDVTWHIKADTHTIRESREGHKFKSYPLDQ